jgi:uncharacterized membrane protein
MNWKTWSPFQSAQVRDICAHMTDAERKAVARRGAFYGLWCGATVALPISQAVTEPSRFALVAASILCTVHIICMPFWLRWHRRFLCGTAWAREQGLHPGHLRLFDFSKWSERVI